MMEENLRRAMIISFGDRRCWSAFPVSAVALLLAIALPALAKREEATQKYNFYVY
jgi:TctA family transporter